MIKRNELEKIMYGCITEKRDISKIDRLINAALANEDNPFKFWDAVRSMTRGVTSDHVMARWQSLSEAVYRYTFKPMYVHAGGGRDE